MTLTFSTYNLLDLGKLELLDLMGGDHKVYGSARASTGKSPKDSSKGDDADKGLISFLMRNRHGTPFEHSVYQFFVKAPIFVVREWQRHRIGSFNEQSGRYSPFKPEFYVPSQIRVPSPTNKQGSVGTNAPMLVMGVDSRTAMRAEMMSDFHLYEALLAQGMAKEMARVILPVSMYTSMWWTVNARALMNFLSLRNSEAAQWEIRQYARAIERIFEETMPWTHEAFVAAGRNAP